MMAVYSIDGQYPFKTYGKRSRAMTITEKASKKRLNNPHLWAQLEAISKGTYVNHLGKGHHRQHPPRT